MQEAGWKVPSYQSRSIIMSAVSGYVFDGIKSLKSSQVTDLCLLIDVGFAVLLSKKENLNLYASS